MLEDLGWLAVDRALELGASYVDVRFVASRNENVFVKNGKVEGAGVGEGQGFGVRALKNGAWGFAASNRLERGEVERVAKLSVRIAEASARRVRRPVWLSPIKPVEDKVSVDLKRDPFDVPLEDKVSLLLEAEGRVRKCSDRIKVSMASYSATEFNKLFLSSEGSNITQRVVFCGAGTSAIAMESGEVQVRSKPGTFGGDFATRGYEFIDSLDLLKCGEEAGREAAALLEAKPCPSKVTTIILDPHQLALQVHESCGHPSELDRVLGTEASFAGTSFLTLDKLGVFNYGSPLVNIVDDSTIPGALGSYAYDDEGVPSQRRCLVKDGLFVGYMMSRETAVELGLTSNGSMRASGYDRIPLIRMSNTVVLPGDWTLEEMVADAKEGLYMATNKSWSIDDRRLNFQFGTQIAYEIKDGCLGSMVKNATYTGITYEFWRSVDAVGKDFKVYGIPGCGKGEPGQVMWVGNGGPHVRIRNVRVGVHVGR